ncbi:MAG: ABC transporter substrate-binding protein [Sulfuritalea sp.]|nr:ABC transporter substrate-binding protein [Sulfuritalea sp.]
MAEKHTDDKKAAPDTTGGRREFLRHTAGLATGVTLLGVTAGSIASVASGAHLAGTDMPEKRVLRVGFMPLTDCASVVMAATEGFDVKHGIRIALSRETSWASVRDKLVNGELDAAHSLYGMVYGLHLGVGGPQLDMNILMTLNQNGQGISFARQMEALGAVDGPSLFRLVAANPVGTYTFAQTFPTGTHAMWLYYWLATHGIHPLRDVKTIVVPPPQMIAACKAGVMHGFCVGEPWNQHGIDDGVSFSVASSQDVWNDHPEKVLATTAAWAAAHPHAARALTAAMLDASRWIDASDENRSRAAAVIAGAAYVGAPREAIIGRMLGRYEDGRGSRWNDPLRMKFFADGAVNYPYPSDGMWLLTQQRRWGLLEAEPDYLAVARAINRTDIYAAAASEVGVSLPASEMRSHRLVDGAVWDGTDPAGYANSFAIHA